MNAYEVTNPVFNTAKMTSFFLAESGNEYAKKLIARTGFDKELAYKSNPLMQIMILPNMIGQEVRYEAVNRLVRQFGNKNILDLACGFSPRGIEMVSEGYIYHGGDLQMVVPVIEPIVKELAGKDADRINYYVVDVTDLQSCLRAVETMDGPVTVITEGLMPYLNDAEKKTLFLNIAEILKQKGGVYVCPDFNDNDIALKMCMTILGAEALAAVAKTQEQFTQKGDRESNGRMTELNDVCPKILSPLPFEYELAELYPTDCDVRSYGLITDGAKLKALKGILSTGVMLIAKYDKTKDVSASAATDTKFAVTSKADGANLCFKVSGRMDSITAPSVVDEYNRVTEDRAFDTVCFDFTSLDYISSAGLRVLLNIKKSIVGDLTVYGANDEVKQVFDMTGFDSMIIIK